MQKSFIDRIFPQTSSSFPRRDRSPRPALSPPTSPALSSERSTPPRTKPRQQSPLSRSSLQALPLSASVVHHNNPLLPIERTAKALERHIQTLLDAQSEGLLAGLQDGPAEDVSSAGSLTPTPSVSSPVRKSPTLPKVVPVRQPTERRISLRQARRRLQSSMQEFADLKNEELVVLENQYRERENALSRVRAFETKRSALKDEVESVKKAESAIGDAKDIRHEASELERTIRELENKLLEMKADHRRLIERATQLENTVDSKLSSYNSSIAMTDMEIRKFLRNPPIQHGLSDPVTGAADSGMYELRPERRTIEMAREQWTSEKESLHQRRLDIETEQQALSEGSRIWGDAVRRITSFEKQLQAQMKALSQPSTHDNHAETEGLLADLKNIIKILEDDFSTAQSKQWNLLICALGAELEALRQGRSILEQALGTDQHIDTSQDEDGLKNRPESNGLLLEEDNDPNATQDGGSSPPAFFTPQAQATPGPNGTNPTGDRPTSAGGESNKSLEDTLREFGGGTAQHQPPDEITPFPAASSSSSRSAHRSQQSSSTRKTDPKSETESEDDDPAPDFWISQ